MLQPRPLLGTSELSAQEGRLSTFSPGLGRQLRLGGRRPGRLLKAGQGQCPLQTPVPAGRDSWESCCCRRSRPTKPAARTVERAVWAQMVATAGPDLGAKSTPGKAWGLRRYTGRHLSHSPQRRPGPAPTGSEPLAPLLLSDLTAHHPRSQVPTLHTSPPPSPSQLAPKRVLRQRSCGFSRFKTEVPGSGEGGLLTATPDL